MKEPLKRYDEIRAASRELNTELFRMLGKSEMTLAGRQLGLVKKNQFLLESEEEFDQFTDYAICDFYNKEGKNAAERYLALMEGEIGEIETAYLNGLLDSWGSLFEVIGLGDNPGEVLLQDLLHEDRQIVLTDKGFSASSEALMNSCLLYSRVLVVEGLCMTSGAPKLFKKDAKEMLLLKYIGRMKKVPFGNEQTKQSVAFHKLHGTYGHHQIEYR